jgi:extracellular elastinolytic metalloproteinase
MKNYYSIFLVYFLLILTTLSYGQDKKDIIKNYLLVNSASLNLSVTDANQFTVTSYGTLKNPDYSIAYLQQEVGGIKIANTSATVLLKNNVVTSFKHAFINNILGSVSATAPSLTATEAARQAISQLGLNSSDAVTVVNYSNKEDVKASELDNSNFEAPLTYFKSTGGNYVLAYELLVKTPDSHWWSTKINASNGALLDQFDLMISCNFDLPIETDAKPSTKRNHNNHGHSYEKNNIFINFKKDSKKDIVLEAKSNLALANTDDGSSYNAFPLGVETPNHGVRSTITNPATITTQPEGSIVPSPEGWHDFDGIIEAKTAGNNVQAYEDPTGTSTALPTSFAEPSTPGTLVFDYPIDYNLYPTEYNKAAIVNLFVWNNYMHDVSYAYGFDETNGNFQNDDYDRFNGVDDPMIFNTYDNDEVQAEAQDGSGLNNANFGTSDDGSAPRMQMFLWGASPFGDFFDVIEPSAADLLGSYASARFPFVAIPREEDPSVDALLVLVEDDGTPYTGVDDGGTAGESFATEDGCTTYTAASAAAVEGKIAVIMRGTCTFVKKITLAQQNGAIAVIIINNAADAGPVNGGGEEYVEITIPAISLSLEDGQLLLDRMLTEDVFGRLIDRGPVQNLINRDGDLDQGIIAHEYAHGISTRLVGGRIRFDCLISLVNEEEMGEGWSDFFGLITTTKTTDTAEQKRGIGTYVQFQGTDGPGIRPAPYSTDMSVNDYTYGDTASDPSLSVPHGIGFVWATILWDMYWAFVAQDGYSSDIYYGTGGNNKAIQLVVDGLKLITCDNVGFVTGRDAIIEADAALYNGDNECLIRTVFARRGVGALASQGAGKRNEDNIEDFTVNPLLGSCDNLAVFDNTKTLFSVYPNPVNSELFIMTNKNAGNAVISIVDMNGRQLVKTEMDIGSQSRVDTANLVQGVYIITIKLEDGTSYSQKLIKE